MDIHFTVPYDSDREILDAFRILYRLRYRHKVIRNNTICLILFTVVFGFLQYGQNAWMIRTIIFGVVMLLGVIFFQRLANRRYLRRCLANFRSTRNANLPVEFRLSDREMVFSRGETRSTIPLTDLIEVYEGDGYLLLFVAQYNFIILMEKYFPSPESYRQFTGRLHELNIGFATGSTRKAIAADSQNE